MNIKIYIASSFNYVSDIKMFTHILETNDFYITQKWWNRIYNKNGKDIKTTELKEINEYLSSDLFYSLPETKTSFELDLEGIKECDALLFIAGKHVRKYNGASVELGIAIGLNKPCYLIGKLENSALFYPLKRCSNIVDFIYRIRDDFKNDLDESCLKEKEIL